MPAYDPKRPRPSASRAEEPAPVEALLEPADPAPVTSPPPVEPASDAPEVGSAPDGAVSDAAASDAAMSEEPVSEESVPAAGEVAAVSEDPPMSHDETPSPDDGGSEAPEVEATSTSSAPRDVDDVEVDLRDVSPNGSHAGSHEVPVAPAPNEVTANRAVLVAGISAAALVALIVAVLLRRRRRSD